VARLHEPRVLACREGFTGHRSGHRNPVLWTLGVSLSAHLRWLNISDRRRSLRTLRNANRRLCNQAFFIKIYIDEDDQLRVENNRPFEMLLDPQINANALTCAQNGNKARIETKGFEPCAWGYLDVHFDTRIWVGARRG